jgi:AcrR family transcriptional regulator
MRKSSRRRHGNLRRVVLDASLALIAAEGVSALSMREVARKAGVTHAAPYHHFRDRAAILAALAEEGFGLLAAGMRSALNAIPAPDVQQRFEACGVAYFEFALRHPAYFRVMGRPELSEPAEHPGVDAAGAAVLQIVVECVRDLRSAKQAASTIEPMVLVLTGWSSAHGLATLWVDGPLSRGLLGGDPHVMARSVAHTLGDLIAASGILERLATVGAPLLKK